MVWATKSLERDRDYVVIKHALKDMNGDVAGVKFRGGYAVIEKGSKAYLQIKQVPLIKGQPEFPLIFLRKLPFITRTVDVKVVYGQDVYAKYLQELNKELAVEQEVAEVKAEETHIQELHKCAHTTQLGVLCSRDAVKGSPSNYCRLHLLEDTKLESVGIVVPKRLTKEEKKEYKEKIASKLEKLSS